MLLRRVTLNSESLLASEENHRRKTTHKRYCRGSLFMCVFSAIQNTKKKFCRPPSFRTISQTCLWFCALFFPQAELQGQQHFTVLASEGLRKSREVTDGVLALRVLGAFTRNPPASERASERTDGNCISPSNTANWVVLMYCVCRESEADRSNPS